LNANTKLTAGYRTGNLTGVGAAGNAYALKAEYNTAGWGTVLAYTADNDAINSGAGAANGVPGLALTIADTRSTMLAFRVSQGAVTYKFGAQHIQFQNPSNASYLTTTTIPSVYGLPVASVNTGAFTAGNRVQDAYWLGANWQVSAPLELSAAYYRRNDSQYGASATSYTMLAPSSKADYFSLMAKYSLSKRTYAYATANFTKTTGGAWSTGAAGTSVATATTPNLQVITVGMAHSF
jgi:predicted porin